MFLRKTHPDATQRQTKDQLRTIEIMTADAATTRRPQRTYETPTALLAAFRDLRDRNEMIRTRDAAEKLGVSEAELVACRTGDGVTRLKSDFGKIIKALPALRTVMILTRNDHVVHEKVGEFGKINIQPSAGIVLNHHIDLRLFLNHWHFGFAVTEKVKSGIRHSLQFFALDGNAIHKVYLRDESDKAAYDALVKTFTSDDQSADLAVATSIPKNTDRPDSEIDVDGLKAHWAALQDTHDFYGMLRDFGVGREQALRLVGDEFVTEVAPSALRAMLTRAAETKLSIMCFVGNPGCIQIHTGPVETLKEMGPWYNVLDPQFNLHLREDRIARAWVVRKPTRDGIVTSLELYDDDGANFVQFFGERKPGQVELDDWRDLAAALPRAGSKEAA